MINQLRMRENITSTVSQNDRGHHRNCSEMIDEDRFSPLLNTTVYIDCQQVNAFGQFITALDECMKKCMTSSNQDIIFVCIGTDRSTGDSLGPLVGHKLRTHSYKNIYLFGTLQEPVHAKNLEIIQSEIKKSYTNPMVIAIDACLGKADHVGYVTVSDTPMKPGAGVNKILPEIGDISITGIVNVGGFMDFLVLQNTRLSLVMKMSDLISSGINYVLWKKYSPASISARSSTFSRISSSSPSLG